MNHPLRRPLAPLSLTLAAVVLLGCATQGSAYQVVRDANHPKPLEDSIVLFEKGKGIDHLNIATEDTTSAELLDDGRLRLRFEGDQWANIILTWKDGGGIPKSIDLTENRALIIRMHVEGFAKVPKSRRDRTLVDGDLGKQPMAIIIASDGDNGWIAAGKPADFTEDGRNPLKAADLVIPTTYFVPGKGGDLTDIRGFVLRNPGRPGQQRRYDWIIEKITIAE